LMTHGAIYLQLRSDAEVQARAKRAAQWMGLVFIISFAVAGLCVAYGIDGYILTSHQDFNAALNPLSKTVSISSGAWLNNYQSYPWMMAAPLIGFLGMIFALLNAKFKNEGLAFIGSSLSIAGVILTAGFSMFPFVMPSATDPVSSLTMWDAVSSKKTMGIMLVVTLIFLPLILMYTSWVFSVLKGKVTVQTIQDHSNSMY